MWSKKKIDKKVREYLEKKQIEYDQVIKTIKLTCNKCNRKMDIRTTRPETYTEEVRKNYVCIFCRK